MGEGCGHKGTPATPSVPTVPPLSYELVLLWTGSLWVEGAVPAVPRPGRQLFVSIHTHMPAPHIFLVREWVGGEQVRVDRGDVGRGEGVRRCEVA